jgi:hypothetical protein
MKLIAIALLIGTAAFAQDAKIMILDQSDTAKLSDAYKHYKEAQKEWEKLKTATAVKYTGEGKATLKGWEKVQFSADFRAVVPEASEYAYHNSCNTSGLYYTPSGWSNAISGTGVLSMMNTTGTSFADTAINSGSTLINGDLAVTGTITDTDDGVNQSLKTKIR